MLQAVAWMLKREQLGSGAGSAAGGAAAAALHVEALHPSWEQLTGPDGQLWYAHR